MSNRTHPPAAPHGSLREVFSNVFFVTGTVGLPGALPVRFSRNMVVVREGERLVLVNSVRLSEDGLRELDRLGKVTDVIRLAAFHGKDDPFYAERYGAKTHTVAGQKYVAEFDASAPSYHVADAELSTTGPVPLSAARLYVIASTPPEGLLLLERDGGILISGDALQNWQRTDEFFSFLARPMMHAMGFIKPYNVGPAWFKGTKPTAASLRGILELPFEHLLPAHGLVVQGGAREHYRPAIDAAVSRCTD